MIQAKAFLVSKNADGDWGCTPFRDVEPLISAAKIAVADGEGSAAIHVGFWRPETAAVAALAANWPGRVLLSDAAAAGMPPPLPVGSLVGKLDGLGFRIALAGFGYQIEDPPPCNIAHVSQEPHSQVPMPAAGRAPRGWLMLLASIDGSLYEAAQAADIWDDESYVQRECNLGSARLPMGIARFRALAGESPLASNILGYLHLAPPWMLAMKLERLPLTVRQENVFRTHNLSVVADIAARGYQGMLKLPALGRGSLSSLAEMLKDALLFGRGLSSQAEKPEPPDVTAAADKLPQSHSSGARHTSLLAGFKAVADSLDPRERGVWAARLGFGCEAMTLQQISDDLGVTRERVRQIENSVYRKSKSHPFWDELGWRFEELLPNRESPLLIEGLSAFDPWFDGCESLGKPLEEVFSRYFERRLAVVWIEGRPIASALSDREWRQALQAAESLLSAATTNRLEEPFARSFVEGLLVGRGVELRSELWALASRRAVWASPKDGPRLLCGYGRTTESILAAVIESSDRPLHIDDIVLHAAQITSRPPELLSLRNAALQGYVLYGRSTFGLPRHCPLSESEMENIRAEVEAVTNSAEPGRQWHASELFDELMKLHLGHGERLDKYVLNFTLRGSTQLEYLGRMVWMAKHVPGASAPARLDMRQAAIALLEREGRPLSTAEIRNLLAIERGVNNTFQIHADGNLLRIGSGMWGLATRDIDLERTVSLLDKLKETLGLLGCGLHLSEIPAFLEAPLTESEVQALVSFGRTHGVRVDRWQHAHLDEWDDARRISPLDAIRTALTELAPSGAPHDFICQRVNTITGRLVPRTHVSSMMKFAQARFDAESGLWFIAEERVETDDELSETEQA